MTKTANTPGVHPHQPVAKNLGIWMDHSHAHLMEFTTDIITTGVISNCFTHREKAQTVGGSEDGLHQKQQQHLSAYYGKLKDTIRKFHNVILFGPTTAKIELLHLLQEDHQFEHVRIETRDSNKMTQNEQQAFVRNYFLSH